MTLSTGKAAELVSTHLGEKEWSCTAFGAGKFSDTFIVEAPDTKQYVLRIAPPDDVLQLFYEHQKYIVIAMSSRRNDPNGAKRYARQSLQAVESFRKTGAPVF